MLTIFIVMTDLECGRVGSSLLCPQPPPASDSGQGAGLQIQISIRQTDGAYVIPGLDLTKRFRFFTAKYQHHHKTHLSVQT